MPEPSGGRNRSLDGLRGLAVLLVILYHHGLLNSGWMGVDFFFVLSGYLITTILWRTRTDSNFWPEFWIKRATRILPPLLLVLALTAILSHEVSPLQATAYVLSFGDILAWLRPTFEPLRPLWSLAVEEHFYLLWPFAVRLLPRRTLIELLCAIVLLEPIARAIAIAATRDWQFVYFLTPFRLDGLALGCLLALLLPIPKAQAAITRYSAPGCTLTVAIWFTLRLTLGHDFTRDSPTIAYSALCYTLIAALAFFAIAHLLTHPKSPAAQALAWKPLAGLGTISYGVYLYHVPLRELLRTRFNLGIHTSILIDLPAVLILSWLSYRFVEAPLIVRGKRKSLALQLLFSSGPILSMTTVSTTTATGKEDP